jgi:DNA-binding MarR family transcriptional regulator
MAGRDRLTDIGPGGAVGRALGMVVRRHRMVAAELLKPAGLYPGQELLMMYLWKSGPVRQADLIRNLGIDPSTVTKMLVRLEKSGHVARHTDPADRRAMLIEATPTSYELRSGIEDAWAALENRTVAKLDAAEHAELLRLLNKVTDALWDDE